jgi:hypothetical protein
MEMKYEGFNERQKPEKATQHEQVYTPLKASFAQEATPHRFIQVM